MTSHDPTASRIEHRLFLVACLPATLWMLMNGWVSDDAYITFRVVDNFVQGFGLRWNIAERVQVFTHPLWMFLHIPFYFFFRHIFAITLLLSWTCSIGAVALTLKTFKRRPLDAVLLLLLPLVISKPMIEYSSSGLENPLTFLLFAAFGYRLARPADTYFWLWMSLLPALSMLNRLDTAVLYAPITLFLVWQVRGQAKWGQIVAGALPVVLWEIFSLIYYGFPFPNTKYAKLNTGITASAYAEQGLLYIFELWRTDAVSIVLLVFGLGSALHYLLSRSHSSRHDVKAPLSSVPVGAVVTGVLFYLAYIVRVGGDFMSGRFLSLPIFVAIWLLFATFSGFSLSASPRRRLTSSQARAAWLVAWALLKFFSLVAAKDFRPDYREYRETYGIADERRYYKDDSTLMAPDGRIRTDFNWDSVVLVESRLYVSAEPTRPFSYKNIGAFVFYAHRPSWHVVDLFGLAEPLLARLPTIDSERWRIGHFERRFPDGFMQAVQNGDTSGMQPDLARYTEALLRVTRGPLFDRERWADIVAFSLGRHDELLRRYHAATHLNGTHNLLALNNLGTSKSTARLVLRTEQGMLRTLGVDVPANGFRMVREEDLWPQLDESELYSVTVEAEPPTVDARWHAVQGESYSDKPWGSLVRHGWPLTNVGSVPDRHVIANFGDGPWPALLGVGDTSAAVKLTTKDSAGREVAEHRLVVEPGHLTSLAPAVHEKPLILELRSEGGSAAPLGLIRRPVGSSLSNAETSMYLEPSLENDHGLLFPALWFVEGATGLLSVRNFGSQTADIRLTSHLGDGPIYEAQRTVPAGGLLTLDLKETFPRIDDISGHSVHISGSRHLAAAYRLLLDAPRAAPIGFISAVTLQTGDNGILGVGPGVAHPDQGLLFGYLPVEKAAIVVGLTNLSGNHAEATVTISDADGGQYALEGRPTVQVQLPPFQSQLIMVSNLLPLATGPVRLTATCDTGPIHAVASARKAGYQPVFFDAAVIDRPATAP